MNASTYIVFLWAPLLLLGIRGVEASTIAVDTNLDELNVAGNCSLREAIIAANSNADGHGCIGSGAYGADTITLPSGTYTLTITGRGDNNALMGDLDILDDLTIQGDGADTTIIDGGEGTVVTPDRIFQIPTAAKVSISDITIKNGNPGNDLGGGIFHDGTNDLELTNVVVQDNIGENDGGGIEFDNAGNLRLAHCVVTGNTAANGGEGGGISFFPNTGNLDITLTTLSNNTATGGSGGGAVYFESPGILTITDSTLSGNKATTDRGGAITALNGTTTLSAVTLNDNAAATNGGAIEYSGTGPLALTNSTVSGNTAEGLGAAIHQAVNSAILTNVTIDKNSGNGALHKAGGGGTITLKNTLIAGTTGGTNCAGAPSFVSGGHNIDSGASCALSGTGDLTNTDPKLDALADNGGPTQTESLQSDSPAIDAGDACPAADQRGFTRPLDGNADGTAVCDIGAFEFSRCGDGVVQPGEQCDDGNTTDGDGCSATCTTETPAKKSGGCSLIL